MSPLPQGSVGVVKEDSGGGDGGGGTAVLGQEPSWPARSVERSAGGGGSEGASGGAAAGSGAAHFEPGRSCRGCLYFSRALQDSGRDPLCFGFAAAEQVPVRMLAQHRQRRQQESAQQNPSNFEKQQKILEDFRYACIGYSVYPTVRPPAASPTAPANPSSPSGAGAGAGAGKAPGPSTMAESQLITRLADAQPLLASPTGQGAHWQQVGATDMSVPGGERRVQDGEPGAGNSAAHVVQARGPATPPPLLPACLGIEILAGTKGDRADQQEQHQHQPQQHMHPQPQYERPPAVPGQGGTRGIEEQTPAPDNSSSPREDRQQPWNRTPLPGAPPGGGMTAEEFSRRYVRMARLISKKCASNYERLKGAIRSTVQDIFKGDK